MNLKRIFVYVIMAGLISSNAAMAVNFQSAPTVGNSNFYPMMQRQMEKTETLDFAKDPENYKKKRAEKDARLDYIEGKTDVNPYLTPDKLKVRYNQNSMPVNMQFTQDGNGQIKIQGIK